MNIGKCMPMHKYFHFTVGNPERPELSHFIYEVSNLTELNMQFTSDKPVRIHPYILICPVPFVSHNLCKQFNYENLIF